MLVLHSIGLFWVLALPLRKGHPQRIAPLFQLKVGRSKEPSPKWGMVFLEPQPAILSFALGDRESSQPWAKVNFYMAHGFL